ncbi:unnamed protein product [Psylliodes chrysocephalus]|uniref:Cyclic nucleotide-binding domain-containing protein n=1 Tax=Psylliodes chrysocephalus TaxID=3402493 RepID=A0A9P0CZE4_9CUCU|nr:unnamed protein product [Psylliodes chrysocephala]
MDLRLRMSLTPEEKLARHKRALRRFRVIVHLVMANRYWLGELEETVLTDNVRRNIKLLTKRKKPLSPLTLEQKSILTKPKELRTEEDKLLLRRAISGMKCFRKYPNETKNKLAECTYFVYFPPGRDIIRQDQVGHAMYYILTGEIRIWVRTFDKFLEEWIVAETGTLNAGDLFGELSLLHDIVRLATFTTKTDCELLMVKKEDFNEVIRETIIRTWTEIHNVFDTFPYFKHWDILDKRVAVTLSKIKHFGPDETILGDNTGYKEYVYFIIKGTCCIVENLTVTVFCIKGFETYILSPLHDEDTRSIKLKQILRKYREFLDSDDKLSIMSDKSRKSRMSERMSIKSRESIKFKKPEESTKSVKSKGSVKSRGSVQSRGSGQSKGSAKSRSSKSDKSRKSSVSRKSVKSHVSIKPSLLSNVSEISRKSAKSEKLIRIKKLHTVASSAGLMTFVWQQCPIRRPTGILFVVSQQLVRRVQQYLTHQIPNTEIVFKKFVEQKKFKKFSKSLIRNMLETHKILTGNTIHNIPYSIRLREGVDTDYF